MTKRPLAYGALGLVALLLFSSSGCGDDHTYSSPVLVGMFEVREHTQTPEEEGCDATMVDVDPDRCFSCAIDGTLFKLKTVSFFGTKLLRYVHCDSETVCDDADEDDTTINLFGLNFAKRNGETWEGEMTTASYMEPMCNVARTEYLAEPTESGGVKISVTTFRGELEKPDQDTCYDLTENPPMDQLECVELEHIEADRIEPSDG